MKIQVVVKAGARHESVEPMQDGGYRVTVSAPPEAGKANEAVLRALGEFIGVPPSRLRIVLGHKSKRKLIEVIDGPSKRK